MIILPVGRTVVYIQPIYLRAAAGASIPELKRLVISQGQIVVMEPSPEEAYERLEERMKMRVERQSN